MIGVSKNVYIYTVIILYDIIDYIWATKYGLFCYGGNMEKGAIGNRIKELCENKGITINALAIKANVPPSTLKNIVNGQVTNTGVETIHKVCNGLNMSLAEFFDCRSFE